MLVKIREKPSFKYGISMVLIYPKELKMLPIVKRKLQKIFMLWGTYMVEKGKACLQAKWPIGCLTPVSVA